MRPATLRGTVIALAFATTPAFATFSTRDPAPPTRPGTKITDEDLPDARVRPLVPATAELLEAGKARSAMFRALVDHLERRGAIVYVTTSWGLRYGVDGRTQLLAVSGRHRFVYITVSALLPADHAIPVLAHELRHAIEIADAPDIRDHKTMAAFYSRHGIAGSSGRRFDTVAARDAGDRVRREMAGETISLSGGRTQEVGGSGETGHRSQDTGGGRRQ
jgi:hypothetical protein